MITRKKNKSAHPGKPDMTPSQLTVAGLRRTSDSHRPSTKKLTKDQQIAALRDELRVAQEAISSVSLFTPGLLVRHTICHRFQSRSNRHAVLDNQPDSGGDTEPATDLEDTFTAVGTKRQSVGSSGPRCVSTHSP